MSKAQMTSRERVMTALSLGEPDIVPIAHTWNTFAFRYAGYKYSECLIAIEKHVDAHLRCLADFGGDVAWGPSATGYLCEACGGNTVLPLDNPPVPGPHVLNSYEEFEAIEFPSIREKGRVPWVLETVRQLRKALAQDIPIITLAPSPHTIADWLRGSEAMYRDFLRAPEATEALIAKCVAPAIEYAEAIVEAGSDVVWVPEPLCGANCISRKHYARFVYPYSKQLFVALREKGIQSVYHICGNWNDRLDLASDGPTALHLAIEADLAQVKAVYGKVIAMMGNIKAVDFLYGTPEGLDRATRDCMAQGAPGGGFILSGDCGLPPATPKENMMAVMRAARA